MATYEWRCEACETAAETVGKFSDPPPPCPKCGRPMKRLISKTSFALKGGGWGSSGYSGGKR